MVSKGPAYLLASTSLMTFAQSSCLLPTENGMLHDLLLLTLGPSYPMSNPREKPSIKKAVSFGQ